MWLPWKSWAPQKSLKIGSSMPSKGFSFWPKTTKKVLWRRDVCILDQMDRNNTLQDVSWRCKHIPKYLWSFSTIIPQIWEEFKTVFIEICNGLVATDYVVCSYVIVNPPLLGDTDSKKSKRRRVCSITTFLRCVETILLLLSVVWYVRDMLDRKTCNCIKTKYLSDDFDYVLEIPYILFFYRLSGGKTMQKREYLEFQEQSRNRP